MIPYRRQNLKSRLYESLLYHHEECSMPCVASIAFGMSYLYISIYLYCCMKKINKLNTFNQSFTYTNSRKNLTHLTRRR